MFENRYSRHLQKSQTGVLFQIRLRMAGKYLSLCKRQGYGRAKHMELRNLATPC